MVRYKASYRRTRQQRHIAWQHKHVAIAEIIFRKNAQRSGKRIGRAAGLSLLDEVDDPIRQFFLDTLYDRFSPLTDDDDRPINGRFR